jgi:transcriptional regulator with XRE-family HTH domain
VKALIREKLGSQKVLASKLDVGNSTLSQWFSAKPGRHGPSVDDLIRIREALDVSWDELMGTETAASRPADPVANDRAEIRELIRKLSRALDEGESSARRRGAGGTNG